MAQQEMSREVQEIWALFRKTGEQIKEVAKHQEETDKQIKEVSDW